MCAICCQLLWNIPQGIEMVSVCTVPARGGRSCEHFSGYKTINRIPLPLSTPKLLHYPHQRYLHQSYSNTPNKITRISWKSMCVFQAFSWEIFEILCCKRFSLIPWVCVISRFVYRALMMYILHKVNWHT